MALLCELCQTANRDGAKFCKGCGRKIAQSWPDGDGATLVMGHETLALAGASARVAAAGIASETTDGAGPASARPGRSWRLIIPAASLILFVIVVAWFAMAHRSEVVSEAPNVPLVSAPAASRPPIPTPAPAPAPSAPLVESASSTLSKGDTAGPAASSPIGQTAERAPEPEPKPKPARKPAARKPAPAPAPVETSPPPVPTVAPPPAPPTPQEACAGLNFVAKARCLATQCARAEQKAHPQCQAVREQQRLEEEKRNPQLAG